MSYGYCRCGAQIKSRTRGIPPVDTCENGHQNDARLTLMYDPAPQPAAKPEPEQEAQPFGFPLQGMVFIPAPDHDYEYANSQPLPEFKFSEATGEEAAVLEAVQKAMAEKFVSPCPPPTAYQNELLDILIEECAEVIQRATKMKRFGVEEVQSGQDFTNRERLSHELGDLFATYSTCIDAGLVCEDSVLEQIPIKKQKLGIYMQNEKDAA